MAGGSRRGEYEVITGGADGVDEIGEEWAEEYDCEYNDYFHIEPDEWDIQGRSAGPKRNKRMAEYAKPDGMLVAIWDGKSKGTRDMIDRALDKGLDVHVFTYS